MKRRLGDMGRRDRDALAAIVGESPEKAAQTQAVIERIFDPRLQPSDRVVIKLPIGGSDMICLPMTLDEAKKLAAILTQKADEPRPGRADA